MGIADNLGVVRSALKSKIKLVVATKNRSAREINQVLFLGVTDIGESKVAEAKEKKSLVKPGLNWHLIGHLQSNKVAAAVDIFNLIQSVDSLKLAKRIDLVCRLKNKKMAVLIQVNIGREEQKHGILEEDLFFFLKNISSLKNIRVLGLMAIAPLSSAEDARPYFKRMNELFEKVKSEKIPNIEMKYLSMGMSNDYIVAVEEGSNMVRVGSAIFAE